MRCPNSCRKIASEANKRVQFVNPANSIAIIVCHYGKMRKAMQKCMLKVRYGMTGNKLLAGYGLLRLASACSTHREPGPVLVFGWTGKCMYLYIWSCLQRTPGNTLLINLNNVVAKELYGVFFLFLSSLRKAARDLYEIIDSFSGCKSMSVLA